MSLLKVTALRKRFKARTVVKDVSFEVGSGEVVGLLGPNGAGKTTTIQVICTLLRPTAGGATVAGHDVVREPAAVRRAIGLVFQDPTLDEYLTAAQNLRFHAYAYGIPRGERDRRMRELLEMMELTDRRDSRVREFSGGMKRRLEIARGLLHHPRVLVLDEPTLGLDPQTRRRIWEHVHDLRRREGVTIMLTTHYMDEAELCDRVAVIDHGRIVALDRPAALKDRLGGDVVTLSGPDGPAIARELERRLHLTPEVSDGRVRVAVPHGEELLPALLRDFPLPLASVSVHRPTLDDVFLDLTGREIRDEGAGEMDRMRGWARVRR